jgi:hypothetical protein
MIMLVCIFVNLCGICKGFEKAQNVGAKKARNVPELWKKRIMCDDLVV